MQSQIPFEILSENFNTYSPFYMDDDLPSSFDIHTGQQPIISESDISTEQLCNPPSVTVTNPPRRRVFTILNAPPSPDRGVSDTSFMGTSNIFSLKRKFSDDPPPAVTMPSISSTPKKKSKKHDTTQPMDFIQLALRENDYTKTGIFCYNGILAYEEDKFFQFVLIRKGEQYNNIKQTSFFEKFDRSRRVNRVNPKEKYGPIKFIKLERNKIAEYPLNVQESIESIDQQFNYSHKLKFLTYRDWGALPREMFIFTK
jgi:hypothetical protein